MTNTAIAIDSAQRTVTVATIALGRAVRPNDPNSRPIIVGGAPSRWLRSGNTGTAIEYATMSVNVAHVTRATVNERESLKDMGNSRCQPVAAGLQPAGRRPPEGGRYGPLRNC